MTTFPSCRAAAVALALVATTGCGERAPATVSTAARAQRDRITLDPSAQQQAGITLATVATVSRADETEAPGLIAVDEGHTARLGSLVQGIVLDVSVQVGDRVSVGQVLARLHSPVVHEAWAAYRKAVAERRRLEKELAFAVAAHERARRLFDEKALSLQDVQRAEANRVAAEEYLDVGRTEVRRGEEELEHFGITSGDDPTGEAGEQIPVRSPIRGVVLERLVTPGTAVNPGTPLFVVSDLSSVWALLEIDETLLAHVHVGRPVQVRVAAYPEERFTGLVAFVGDTVNPRTRRVTVRCEIANADRRLKPEMYATAFVRESEPRDVVVVPSGAVQTLDNHAAVFVSEAPNQFRLRRIDTGAEAGGLVEVNAGLRPGERIAATGSFALKAELLKAASPEGG
jgi:cobalt-zinc-cadmium efflux system membrane fusion protein